MSVSKENRIELDGTLGRYLKAMREKNSYNQKRMAEILQMSPAMVGYIENSERMPTMQTLLDYATHFAVDINVLVTQRIITVESTVARHREKTPHHIMNEYHLIEHLSR